LQIATNSFRCMSTVVKSLFGCVTLMTVSMTAQAQTYYYYPTSVPTIPNVVPGSTYAPARYWQRRPGNQVVWYTYSPQYYQTANPTQAPQAYRTSQYSPPTYQTQAAQAPVDTPGAPTATSDAAPAQTTTAVAAAVGDPYGFVGWLNATRAAYGLPAVGYDANLSNWAAMNNNQQAARGMGHFVMGPARRQNSAMGAFASIGSMWMNSPAHRAALLDPTITAIGIAGLGAYWTFNAY
jgi:uncharacterized protein YkwD